MTQNYWLTNVLLESGFTYENEIIRKTETTLYHLKIKNGVIEDMIPATARIADNMEQVDAKGRLLIPSFREMHQHLDKTYYGGEWKAPTAFESIFQRLREEEEMLPGLVSVTRERANKILDLHKGNGTTHIRAQANVDHIVGMRNFEEVKLALQDNEREMSHELVAFPQQGLLRSDAKQLVKEALKNGATHVGGVDPASVDLDVEKSLYTMCDLAVEQNAGVDVHIHDEGHLGTYTMKRLAAYTIEAGLQGKVSIGHGFSLGTVSADELEETVELLREARIDLASTVPFEAGFPTPPIPYLKERGIKVSLANDSILDHWEAFGTGDMLYKASILSERFSLIDELSLSQNLQYITGGITPLNQEGKRIWPTVGDELNAVLVDASCSAEAVARRSARCATIYKGKVTAGEI